LAKGALQNSPLRKRGARGDLSTASQLLTDWLFHVRQSFIDFDYRAPDGESSHEAQRRGREALNALLAQQHHLPVVVTPGNLLTLILHSLDPVFDFAMWEQLTNPDIYLLSWDDSANNGGRWERLTFSEQKKAEALS
jgi:2,3-bisphosphoglycerate-dependent phosphoglycerate mutase